MAHDNRYSMARPSDLRRTVRFVRHLVLDDAAPADAAAASIAADPGDEDVPMSATPVQVVFGKREITIERAGEHVQIRVPGGTRLTGTRDQVVALLAALTAAI